VRVAAASAVEVADLDEAAAAAAQDSAGRAD